MEIVVKDEIDSLADAPVDASPVEASPVEAPAEVESQPQKAKRGRPAGSKNKVKIIEPPLPEALPEPDPPEPPPKKARARVSRAPAAPPVREAPIDTGIQTAAAMLHLLRAEQAERQEKGQLSCTSRGSHKTQYN